MKTSQLTSRFSGNADLHSVLQEEVATDRSQLTPQQHRITDNLSQLIQTLPESVRTNLANVERNEDLLEIVMDLGRVPEARFADSVVELGDEPITKADLAYVVERVGSFGKDNRAGIERTLHRISAIRNRTGDIVGLTCRIGRAVYGTIDIIQDIVQSGKSILMLGRPGRGKTTKLREVARILSTEMKKRVVIVDTSNEIAGDGDIPHPAIGRARRMQVATPEEQHAVMIEAVENHMPEVIVIDEIGTEQEAFAARTIAERGVQLVGTAHGNTLENLMLNPTLTDLVGGIHAVTLSDDEAKRRGTQKTVLERKAPPTFDIVIEIIEVNQLAIHLDVAKTVDRLLRGAAARPEIRIYNENGEIQVIQKGDDPGSIREIPDSVESDYRRGKERADSAEESTVGRVRITPLDKQEPKQNGEKQEKNANPSGAHISKSTQNGNGNGNGNGNHSNGHKSQQTMRVFPYGVSRSRLERAIAENHVPCHIARDLSDADVVVALKATYKREPGKMREAAQRRLPIYTVRSNTYTQIANCIRGLFGMTPSYQNEEEELDDALQETHEAIAMVRETNEAIELAPASSYTRRLQHQLAERFELVSESVGIEPNRRVRILPIGA